MDLKYEIIKKRHSVIHLDDLILIFKCLYPHLEIINPFEQAIYQNKSFTPYQSKLINQLIEVSCLVNQKHRKYNHFIQYEAIEEDYINALSLADRELNPERPDLLLNNSVRRLFIRIKEVFGEDEFTNRQVQRAASRSKTYVHYSLSELCSKGLLKINGKGKGYNGQFLYQLNEKCFKS